MAILTIVDQSSGAICIFWRHWLWRFSLCMMTGHAFKNLCYLNSLTGVSTIADDWILARYGCRDNINFQICPSFTGLTIPIFWIWWRWVPAKTNIESLHITSLLSRYVTISINSCLLLWINSIVSCGFHLWTGSLMVPCHREEIYLTWWSIISWLCMNPWFPIGVCRNWCWWFYSKIYLQI